MRGQRYRVGNQNITASTYNEKYEETMIYRLYFEDAQGLSHYRLVHEHDSYSIVGGFTDGQDSTALTARSLRQGWSEQLANVSRQLSQLRRFGGAANFGRGLFVYNSHVESDLKTFERVPGATVTGTVRDATENTSVVVAVEMETNTGRTFTYTQRASTADDGSFQITVPYATTNEVMPADGGTDTAVTATGEYRLFVSGAGPFPTRVANFSVPEPAVYDGGTVDVGTVEVPEPDQPDGNGNTSERIGSPTSIPTPTPTPTPAPDPSVSLAPGGGPASGVTVASGPSPPDGAIADPAR